MLYNNEENLSEFELFKHIRFEYIPGIAQGPGQARPIYNYNEKKYSHSLTR